MPGLHASQNLVLHLHDLDDVGVARRTLAAGTPVTLNLESVKTLSQIPTGHKVALRDIDVNLPVRKFGQVIGFASEPIIAGEHVHTHNLVARDFIREPGPTPANTSSPNRAAPPARTFPGFLRSDGRVGTRNYIAVISSVNCSASVSRHIRERFRDQDVRRDYPHVDGVVAFTHKSGCSMLPTEPTALLRRVLSGLAVHPNIGGYLMVGLGCEVNHLAGLRAAIPSDPVVTGKPPPAYLEIQSLGGVRRTVEAGVEAVTKLLPVVGACRRTPQPVSKLTLAEQCGGSDAHSGITANPALGIASDDLVRHGGTSVLAETPEIYGAEHLLLGRAVNSAVAGRLLERIRWWERHVQLYGASIDNNPSPGNKAGGLTTIYEKSLGAVAKAGQSPLVAVYEYAEPVTAAGLCFMDTPGNDPVSMTGLVAGGANIAVFTTGRGSVYGCKPTPCIKVASHSALYQQLPDDIDLNAGTILEGSESHAQVARRIFERIIAVAGGQRTQSELAGIGDEEFAPWQLGPTL